MQKYFAEFFAGVGLVREGLAPSGWSCAWANDISPEKAGCYRANYGDDHFHLGDLWQWESDPHAIPDIEFLARQIIAPVFAQLR